MQQLYSPLDPERMQLEQERGTAASQPVFQGDPDRRQEEQQSAAYH